MRYKRAKAERIDRLVQEDISGIIRAGASAAEPGGAIDEATRRIKEAVDQQTLEALFLRSEQEALHDFWEFGWLSKSKIIVPGYIARTAFSRMGSGETRVHLWSPAGEILEDNPIQNAVGEEFLVGSMAIGKGAYRAHGLRAWIESQGAPQEKGGELPRFYETSSEARVDWAIASGREEPFTEGWASHRHNSPSAAYGSSAFMPTPLGMGLLMSDARLAPHVDPVYPASGAFDQLVVDRSIDVMGHPAIEYILDDYLPELISSGRNIN